MSNLTLTKASLTKNPDFLPRQEFVVSGHPTVMVQGQERPRLIVSVQDSLERCVRDLEQAVPQIINNILVALSEAADRNGWQIIDVQADETDAVVLFDRGNSPFGSDHRFGTSAFHFAAGHFGQGHYDMTRDEAQLNYKARCNREFL